MKIYFTASLTGKKYYEKNYLKILSLLKELNCKVAHSDIVAMTKQLVNKKTKLERIAFIKLLHKYIKWCDALVVEVSYPSTSIGYEIALALKNKKPVLALYFDNKVDPPSLIRGLCDFDQDEVTLIDYNFYNLKTVIKDFLDFTRTRGMDKRFTLLLSPKIIKLLDLAAKKKKIPRSVYIRKLIEKDMGKKLE